MKSVNSLKNEDSETDSVQEAHMSQDNQNNLQEINHSQNNLGDKQSRNIEKIQTIENNQDIQIQISESFQQQLKMDYGESVPIAYISPQKYQQLVEKSQKISNSDNDIEVQKQQRKQYFQLKQLEKNKNINSSYMNFWFDNQIQKQRLQKKIRTKFQAKDFELLKHHMRQYKPDSWNDEKLMFPSLYQQKIKIGSPKSPQIIQNFNMSTQPDEDSNELGKSNTQKLYRQKSQGENQFNYFPDSDFIVQQIHSNTPDARLQTNNGKSETQTSSFKRQQQLYFYNDPNQQNKKSKRFLTNAQKKVLEFKLPQDQLKQINEYMQDKNDRISNYEANILKNELKTTTKFHPTLKQPISLQISNNIMQQPNQQQFKNQSNLNSNNNNINKFRTVKSQEKFIPHCNKFN